MNKIQFTAKVEKVQSEGGWHIIRLTPDVLRSLREAAGKNGNVPILVTIGKATWPTTIMSMGEQQWFFAINAATRKSENTAEGDVVSVTMVPDFEKLKKA